MSADELRRAAQTLRERARAATPRPWERGDHWHIQGARFCPCQPSWGKAEVRRMDINGQMMMQAQAHIHRLPDRLGWDHGIYSKAQDADGYYPNVVNDTDEYGLMGDADAEWIATMHPGVGLALADLLEEALADFRDMGSYETCTSIGSAARDLARLIQWPESVTS